MEENWIGFEIDESDEDALKSKVEQNGWQWYCCQTM